jgi:hypothetical protein
MATNCNQFGQHRNFDMELVAINTSGNIHRYNTNTKTFTSFLALGQSTFDMRANDTYLIITLSSTVYVTINKCTSQINSNQIPESKSLHLAATQL